MRSLTDPMEVSPNHPGPPRFQPVVAEQVGYSTAQSPMWGVAERASPCCSSAMPIDSTPHFRRSAMRYTSASEPQQ